MGAEQVFEKIVLPLFATFTGAFFAFRYQNFLEKNRDKRTIVQTLMIYRNVGADELDWVKAMNAIDLVFHNNERVRQLFDTFLEYTKDEDRFNNGDHVRIYHEMVYFMAQDCGYTQITEFDIKKNVYSPRSLSFHYPHSGDLYFQPGQSPKTAKLAELLEECSQYGLA